MSSFTIRASNFRVLERLAWAPRGLCVLSGANGTGKTTTLDALRFLQAVFLWGHDSGLRRVSGAQLLRMQAPPDEPVVFSIQTGDLRWVLRFPMSAQGLQGHFGEELHRGDQVVLRAGMHQDHWFLGTERQEHGEEPRCCAKQLWDRGGSPWMRPLVDLLTGLRVYDAYSLNQVKRVEPVSQGDAFLHGTGRNLWSVLSNWKGAPLRYRGQFDWVMAEVRRAFPGIAGTVEFDRGIPYLFGPGAKDAAEGLLPSRVADGHLTGLLHLTAVAGAVNGSLIAFDEMENQLHPHAIRTILSAFQQQVEERELTIILTTHSPVVLNELADSPERIHVLQGGRGPTTLDRIHDPSWLAHFSLGDLYEREVFAPQTAGSEG